MSIAGHYQFALAMGGDPVRARFSYTFVRDENGKWLITEHHSSALPQGNVRNGKVIGADAALNRDKLQPIDFNNVEEAFKNPK